MHRRICLLVLVTGLVGSLTAEPAARMDPASLPRGTPSAPAAVVDAAALRTHLAAVEAELREDILPFWMAHVRDRQRGGFYGQIDNDLTIHENAPRGALLTSRILWTFSAAYRRNRDPACLEMARWAFDDLMTRFWDKEQGGLFWSITADGGLRDTHKEIYGQAFGIYALAEFYRATGNHSALERAAALYRCVEGHARDHVHGGYLERFTRDWAPMAPCRWGAMGNPSMKSQNTHLHIMEAYTNLLRAWPDPELRGELRQLAEIMMNRFLNPANHHLRLYVDADWTPRSDGISYGHDIEFSWLLLETTEVLGEPDLIARAKAAAVQIARATLAEGLDTDGGLMNEADPKGLRDSGKDWWPQAEAAIGFLNAYQVSGDPAFLQASLRSWDFIATHLIDREHGEWFWGVKRDGTVRRGMDKVGLWKCPYHDGRACMELTDRLRAILPAAP